MATAITEYIGEVEVDRSRHWALADLDALPDDSRRREIVRGVLYVTPVARRYHQRVVFRFTYCLGTWEEEHGGQVYPGVEVNLPEGSHLEPDVAYLVPGHEILDDIRGLAASPDIVVEVSSRSTKRYDLGDKRDLYAEQGVGELWFVDLDAGEVLVFTQGRGEPARYGTGERFTSQLLPSLVLDVDALLAP